MNVHQVSTNCNEIYSAKQKKIIAVIQIQGKFMFKKLKA